MMNVPLLFIYILNLLVSFFILLTNCDINSTSLSTERYLKSFNNNTKLMKTHINDRIGSASMKHERKFKVGRRYSGRSKTYKRDRHRHSTRVTIKPVNYLLPPFETKMVQMHYQNTPRTVRTQIVRKRLTPRNNTRNINRKPVEQMNNLANFILPPATFLLPPYENYENYENIQTTTKKIFIESIPSTTSEYNNITMTTEEVPFTYTTAPLTEPPTTFINYTEPEQYITTISTTENTNQINNSQNFIQKLEDNFQPTYTPQLQNDQKTDNQNNFNLLSNDVASLGMKVATSEKGIEMLKQFHHVENNADINNNNNINNNQNKNEINNNFSKEQFSLISNLDTAESADYWRNNFNKLPVKEAPITKSYTLVRNPYKICKDKLGYVADVSSGCQVFYICVDNGVGEPMLCPNGTLFNQDFLVCDWWYNVDCVA